MEEFDDVCSLLANTNTNNIYGFLIIENNGSLDEFMLIIAS